MKIENKKITILSIIIGFVYFVVLLLTMSDYNIMWDARNHFFKGQAFIHFFLTGKRDYKDLPIDQESARYFRDYTKSFTPSFDLSKRLSKDPNFRRSIYKDEVHTFEWLMQRPPTEHPVLSDIGASFFNVIFYERLNWLRDDHAYHLFAITLASILVGVVFSWMRSEYGLFSAAIATITLVTSPLFLAESHYNIKDIPLLVFFSLAVYSFYRGVTIISKKWIIFSALLSGFAFGTKFNAIFIPAILMIWFFIFYLTRSNKSRKAFHSWWFLIILYPLIMLSVLFISWPQLWNHPIDGFLNVVSYYKSVGVNIDYTPMFRTLFGFSTYASLWILVTTYPLVIFLASAGMIGLINHFKKTNDTLPVLFILGFLIPIARASLPNTSIFGGVRHIIEYIPALSLLAGYGVYIILKFIPDRLKLIVRCLLLVSFLPLLFTLVRFHPAENVYFNFLIGGLPGAKKANLTGWGNTDGGIYRKALVWLNNNAEKNAHIAVGFSETADFYIPEFRKDLLADNEFSGYLQKGEYIVALTHNSELENTYRMRYPEYFLTPLYEYKVDGVALVKVWRNDKQHMKNNIKNLKEYEINQFPERQNNKLYWDLGNEYYIQRIEISFDENNSCEKLASGYFQISRDGKMWTALPESYPGGPIDYLGSQPADGTLIAPISFSSRYLMFTSDPQKSCMLNTQKSKIIVLDK